MPQATEELRRRWHGPSDITATKFLEARGYTLNDSFEWVAPEGHEPTEEELSAMEFMFQEWDYGGLAKRNEETCSKTT